MACAEYQEDLIEAALDPQSDAAHQSSFARHVERCSACRAELERQRAVYSQIEDGVEALVNVSVPASIAARVRQEISARPSRAFAWGNWGWLTAAAVAAAALCVALLYRAPFTPQTPRAVQTVIHPALTAPPVPVTRPAPTAVQSARVTPLAQAPRTPGFATVHASALESPQPSEIAVNTPIGPPRVQVLVPAGQREAVLRLAAALQSGRVDGSSLINPPQSLQPADLQIAPLEIKPLVSEETSDGGNSPDTKPSIRN